MRHFSLLTSVTISIILIAQKVLPLNSRAVLFFTALRLVELKGYARVLSQSESCISAFNQPIRKAHKNHCSKPKSKFLGSVKHVEICIYERAAWGALISTINWQTVIVCLLLQFHKTPTHEKKCLHERTAQNSACKFFLLGAHKRRLVESFLLVVFGEQ